MKAKEVLKILKISRPTLCKYISEGRISAIRLSNGHWDYDKESVYQFLKMNRGNKSYMHLSLSSNKQKRLVQETLIERPSQAVVNGQEGVALITFDTKKLSLPKKTISGKNTAINVVSGCQITFEQDGKTLSLSFESLDTSSLTSLCLSLLHS